MVSLPLGNKGNNSSAIVPSFTPRTAGACESFSVHVRGWPSVWLWVAIAVRSTNAETMTSLILYVFGFWIRRIWERSQLVFIAVSFLASRVWRALHAGAFRIPNRVRL